MFPVEDMKKLKIKKDAGYYKMKTGQALRKTVAVKWSSFAK